MSLIRIDMPKGVEEGSTSVSPKSPKGNSVGSPAITRQNALLLGYSAMAAKAVYNTAVQEISLSGNEELATSISNVIKGIGIAVSVYETGGLILIPMTITAGTQIITKSIDTARQNRSIEYERSMRGSRVSYNMGGGYE